MFLCKYARMYVCLCVFIHLSIDLLIYLLFVIRIAPQKSTADSDIVGGLAGCLMS